MRLTKEQFIKAVNTYEHMYTQESQIMDTLNVNPEWVPSEWVGAYYDLLTEMCEFDDDWIDGTPLDWFCYDWEFGVGNKAYGTLAAVYEKDKDGKEITRLLNTPDKLYDYIIEESPYHE